MNLSTAYLAILAFSLYPRLVKATDWGLQTLLDEFEAPSFLFDPFETSLSSMMRRHQEVMDQAFPRFRGAEVTPQQYNSIEMNNLNDPEQFQVMVHLPSGLSPEDLHVDFDERSRLLTIWGQHEWTNEETGHRSVSQFSRSFNLDPFVEVDQLKATTDDGILTVTAPKNVDKMEHSLRSIPVTQKALEIEAGPEAPATPEPVEMGPKAPTPELRGDAERVETESKEEVGGDSFDPFHIKERVKKTLAFPKGQDENTTMKKNPVERLEDRFSGYKTSELRRRRR